jgi:hypothetical protein
VNPRGPAGRRELYVYWHCVAARTEAAAQAVLACQAALRLRHPDLQARLLRRADAGADGRVTLMEIYARPGGLEATEAAELLAAAAEALAGWADGPRHVEVFEPCAEPSAPAWPAAR